MNEIIDQYFDLVSFSTFIFRSENSLNQQSLQGTDRQPALIIKKKHILICFKADRTTKGSPSEMRIKSLSGFLML